MIRCSIRLFALVLLLLTSIRTSRDVVAAASPTCKHVQAILQETATSPCPILCSIGRLIGNVTGEARFVASTFVPSPVAGTFFITGDTLIVNAQFEGRRGTVSTKNAAVFRPESGDLVDLQTIVGGTGDFSGATGTLQV